MNWTKLANSSLNVSEIENFSKKYGLWFKCNDDDYGNILSITLELPFSDNPHYIIIKKSGREFVAIVNNQHLYNDYNYKDVLNYVGYYIENLPNYKKMRK